ncbi:putative toxin-antitoxin system toxin component, PIN family [Hydrogenophilus thermoluteolus]|nr:putative toxin-antitoxin system toxin component, PIN family [Hydrogenophilus thermoluteolus]MBW7657716.1 putative toxin-antitoxin system toxin component, PIN family [Hydrogenophilus thermoluteolus]
MRLFFDTNVWISAFAAKGLCRDLVRLALALHGGTRVTLVTSGCVAAETARILGDKFNLHGESVDAALQVLALCEQAQDGAIWQPPENFPDADDVAIIAAALAAQADLFITGDKALLALGAVDGMPILEPRAAYLRLRGLG